MSEVRVPNIGDFKDVPVIGILVKPGDKVEKEQPLVTLESEKATLDVPSPEAGTVREVKVKVGDKVSEGTVLLVLEGSDEKKEQLPPRSREEREVRTSSSHDYSVLVLGSGPGGYSAAFRAADLGQKTVLVERYSSLGGVCLNVGCIPSKALLHIAAVMEEARAMAAHGVAYGEPKIDLEKLRSFKNKVVGKLTNGIAAIARPQGRGDHRHRQVRRFAHAPSRGKRIRFEKAIIAAGSQGQRTDKRGSGASSLDVTLTVQPSKARRGCATPRRAR